MLFWELAQTLDIYRAQAAAEAASGRSEEARRKAGIAIVDADLRFQRLALLCSAMWSLLQEKTGITDNELVERFKELDLRDGKLDGRIVKPMVKCPDCGATISRDYNRCLICGYQYKEGDVFDTV